MDVCHRVEEAQQTRRNYNIEAGRPVFARLGHNLGRPDHHAHDSHGGDYHCEKQHCHARPKAVAEGVGHRCFEHWRQRPDPTDQAHEEPRQAVRVVHDDHDRACDDEWPAQRKGQQREARVLVEPGQLRVEHVAPGHGPEREQPGADHRVHHPTAEDGPSTRPSSAHPTAAPGDPCEQHCTAHKRDGLPAVLPLPDEVSAPGKQQQDPHAAQNQPKQSLPPRDRGIRQVANGGNNVQSAHIPRGDRDHKKCEDYAKTVSDHQRSRRRVPAETEWRRAGESASDSRQHVAQESDHAEGNKEAQAKPYQRRRQVVNHPFSNKHLHEVDSPHSNCPCNAQLAAALRRHHHKDQENQQYASKDGKDAETGEDCPKSHASYFGNIGHELLAQRRQHLEVSNVPQRRTYGLPVCVRQWQRKQPLLHRLAAEGSSQLAVV